MEQNICYIASVVQANREITGSYPYSYPYLSSMSLADTADRLNNGELSQTNRGMIVAVAANSGEGENVTVKRRSCDNEEDIYSYIIWHYEFSTTGDTIKYKL